MSGKFGHLGLVPPADPPPHALAEVGAAAARADALARRDRELHFVTGPDGAVAIELRRFDGTVLRRVAPSEALDIMSGLAAAD